MNNWGKNKIKKAVVNRLSITKSLINLPLGCLLFDTHRNYIRGVS